MGKGKVHYIEVLSDEEMMMRMSHITFRIVERELASKRHHILKLQRKRSCRIESRK
jgi:IS1 family transposase